MADYVYISNYSKNGKLAISRKVFEELATEAVNRVAGAAVITAKGKAEKLYFMLYHPIAVTFHTNGQVELKISITLKKGMNAEKVCLTIQEEVANSLMAYTESVPFNINIKLAKII